MADARSTESEAFPKSGRVTEACREWGVREDGALAYRLQNEEITDHYQGNKYRNTVVREDFPRALDEQLREQRLAEQAAAVYHQMLAEQEEVDKVYAKKLADRFVINYSISHPTHQSLFIIGHISVERNKPTQPQTGEISGQSGDQEMSILNSLGGGY